MEGGKRVEQGLEISEGEEKRGRRSSVIHG